MKMNLKTGVLALAAALGGLSGSVQAAPLAANQTLSTLEILTTAPAGTLKASGSETITTPTFTGTLRSAVYDGPETGVNLDFYYQFSNSANSRNGISRVTAFDFTNFTTNVFQTAQAFGIFSAGNVAADTADRGTDGVIGFDMHPNINAFNKVLPGQSSDTFIIRTTATDFAPGFSGVINGTAGFANSYQPKFQPAVPEPSTNALILAGLGLMAFVMRRRTKGDKRKR